MKLAIRNLAVFGVLAVMAATAPASDVGPGSPAPAMSVKTWIKGTPVTSFDRNKLYVVEFWATWCGPCKQSIPHLTELANKNKDVTFVGVSIWEDDKDGNIAKFVADMGDKMNYNVAYSGNKDGMAKTWMEAAGQNGIPTAFVVKQGQIEWVGHPMELEKPLADIKAGTFDRKAFKVGFDKMAAETRDRQAAGKAIRSSVVLYDQGKTAAAKKALADAVAKYPGAADQAESVRFGWLAKEDPKAWDVKATALAQSKKPEAIQALVGFAMSQSDSKTPNHDLAVKAIDLALAATEEKQMDVLYYGMTVYRSVKNYPKALELANKLLAAVPSDNADMKKFVLDQKAQIEALVKG